MIPWWAIGSLALTLVPLVVYYNKAYQKAAAAAGPMLALILAGEL